MKSAPENPENAVITVALPAAIAAAARSAAARNSGSIEEYVREAIREKLISMAARRRRRKPTQKTDGE